MTKRLLIQNGIVTGFSDEIAVQGLSIDTVSKVRVSHILPCSLFARILFILIRSVVSDDSALASWTRLWRCTWFVKIDSVNYGCFTSRADAIAFEKNKIYEMGKLKNGF